MGRGYRWYGAVRDAARPRGHVRRGCTCGGRREGTGEERRWWWLRFGGGRSPFPEEKGPGGFAAPGPELAPRPAAAAEERQPLGRGGGTR